MNRNFSAIWAVAIVLMMLLIGIPFIKNFDDLEKWAQYGTFAAAIMSAITLILVVYAYSATREQMRLTQKQSFDSIFFNFIETHRSIADRLQSGKLKVIKQECEVVKAKILKACQNELKEESKYRSEALVLLKETEEYLAGVDGKDVFDMLYFILDKEYKLAGILWAANTKGGYHEPSYRLVQFFEGRYYLIVHYIRSYISVVKFVDGSALLTPEEKETYVLMLRNLTTTDELRLLFYVIVWLHENDGKEWKQLLDRYDFFASGFIEYFAFNLIDSVNDWDAYKAIRNDDRRYQR